MKQLIFNEVSIDAKEFKKEIETLEDVLVLDVRGEDEFSESHLKDAVNIPVQILQNELDRIEEYKNKPIRLYCRSGRRSQNALMILNMNDFDDIKELRGGILAWPYEVIR